MGTVDELITPQGCLLCVNHYTLLLQNVVVGNNDSVYQSVPVSSFSPPSEFLKSTKYHSTKLIQPSQL